MDDSPPPLPDLPTQPDDVAWPTHAWPEGAVPDGVEVEGLIDDIFGDEERYGTTYAVAVVHRGRLVAERYGNALPKWDRPDEPVERDTPLLSWSMAKSVLHAAIGVLVREGRMDITARAPVPEWQEAGDERAGITIEHLLAMRDGLAFREEYSDAGASEVIEMLFGAGQADVAHFAAQRPLAHPPGEVFNYSSGTSNVLSRIVGDVVGSGPAGERCEGIRQLLHDELFEPIGMSSATSRCDEAGTFVASSYVYATARDFARFGLLYLRDGVWDGRRILPDGWVDRARRPISYDPVDHRWYGHHWWIVGDDVGGFWANGYEGQSILCVPDLDLIAVRLGRTAKELYPNLIAWRAAVTDAFRDA